MNPWGSGSKLLKSILESLDYGVIDQTREGGDFLKFFAVNNLSFLPPFSLLISGTTTFLQRSGVHSFDSCRGAALLLPSWSSSFTLLKHNRLEPKGRAQIACLQHAQTHTAEAWPIAADHKISSEKKRPPFNMVIQRLLQMLPRGKQIFILNFSAHGGWGGALSIKLSPEFSMQTQLIESPRLCLST